MKLTGHAVYVLQALYKSPDRGGDIFAILGEKGISKENAHTVGKELAQFGLIKYDPQRNEYGDADLTEYGIDYIEKNRIM